MKLDLFFRNYERLVDKAESAFQQMGKQHPSSIRCRLHCADCCYAVFGLFLIEALYIREHFEPLEESQKRCALLRGEKADRELDKLQNSLKNFADDPHMMTYALARGRIRCPLLDDKDECILYHRRPITCRVYGIPIKIHEKARVCGKADFKNGVTYPVFNLDRIYQDLFMLSTELLREAQINNANNASFLHSISKIIRTPIEELLHEDLSKRM